MLCTRCYFTRWWDGSFSYHFTDEDIKAQRGQVTCPKLISKQQSWDKNSRLPNSLLAVTVLYTRIPQQKQHRLPPSPINKGLHLHDVQENKKCITHLASTLPGHPGPTPSVLRCVDSHTHTLLFASCSLFIVWIRERPLRGLSSQHAPGWKGRFPAGFSGGVSEQKKVEEHSGRGGSRKLCHVHSHQGSQAGKGS